MGFMVFVRDTSTCSFRDIARELGIDGELNIAPLLLRVVNFLASKCITSELTAEVHPEVPTHTVGSL